MKIEDILKSACGKNNQHLLQKNKAAPAVKKQRKKPTIIKWLDINLQYWCAENNLILSKELKFAPGRKYSSDYAIESIKILIEYEGGIFMQRGGHNSPTGIQRDIDKYRLAEELGFTVLRLTALNYKTILPLLDEKIKQLN